MMRFSPNIIFFLEYFGLGIIFPCNLDEDVIVSSNVSPGICMGHVY